MSTHRPSVFAFLRDFALSLPAFHVRKQRVIVNGDLVWVSADALRPDGPLGALLLQPPALPFERARSARLQRAG